MASTDQHAAELDHKRAASFGKRLASNGAPARAPSPRRFRCDDAAMAPFELPGCAARDARQAGARPGASAPREHTRCSSPAPRSPARLPRASPQSVAVLKLWLSKKDGFQEIDLLKVWLGLFYCPCSAAAVRR